MATTVYASEDAYAAEDDPKVPHNSVRLIIGDLPGGYHSCITYINFDLSDWIGRTLDADIGALIYLHISDNFLTSNTRIRFRRIIDTWDEDTLTWNKKPSVDSYEKKKLLETSDDGWEHWNITDLIQDMLDNEGCCGIRVAIDAEQIVILDSSEGDHSPKLKLTEMIAQEPVGDIVSGDAQPASQLPGESVDIAVNIKNIGTAGGYFNLQYYEGTTCLKTASRAWLDAGQQIDDISEVFTMTDRDFVVTVEIYNDTRRGIDDSYDITCYLIGGTDYYVKTSGNDGLSGSSWANAWATIDKAARTVPDGSTVHIGFGTYENEPDGNAIAPQNIGSEGIFYSPETANSEGGTGTVTIEKHKTILT